MFLFSTQQKFVGGGGDRPESGIRMVQFVKFISQQSCGQIVNSSRQVVESLCSSLF